MIAATPNVGKTCLGRQLTANAGMLDTATVGLVPGGTTSAIPANGSCTVTVNVTAPVAGSFINSLPAGALQTSLGNNAAPAIATLTVNTVVVTPPVVVPPTLGKALQPGNHQRGRGLDADHHLEQRQRHARQPDRAVHRLLPSGLLLIGSTVASTCIELLTPVAAGVSRSPAWFVIGPDAVGLMEGAIPANGSCTVTANVTAPVAGSYFNSVPAGALQTSNGNNAAPAVATLTVTQ